MALDGCNVVDEYKCLGNERQEVRCEFVCPALYFPPSGAIGGVDIWQEDVGEFVKCAGVDDALSCVTSREVMLEGLL